MIHFTTSPNGYKHSLLLLFLLQLSLFIWGLPPFQTGIWPQTEPTMLALFLCAAFTSVALAVGLARRWLAMTSPTLAWICLLLWVAWQLPATLMASSPWRSWFGPPEMGEGAAWHLSLLLLCLLASVLWQEARYRRLLLGAAAANIVVQCVLHWFNPGNNYNLYDPDSWAPAQWPAYLAFMAGYLWLASSGRKYKENGGWYCFLIVLLYGTLYVSYNKSAIFLLLGAMTVSVLLNGLYFPRRLRRFFYPGSGWRAGASVICILPVGVLMAGASLVGNGGHNERLNVFSATIADRDASMGSRLGFHQVVASVLEHEPERWLMGNGWGKFGDDLYNYVLVDGVEVFHHGDRKPNWSVINGYAFNSHDQPLEALLSLGLPGLLLWYALPLFLLWLLPRRFFWRAAPMLVGLTVLGHLWFQIPQCLPYQALALAVLFSLCPGSPQKMLSDKAWVAGLLAAGLLMTWTSLAQLDAIRYGRDLRDAMLNKPYADFTDAWMADDLKRGGDRWLASARFFASDTNGKASRHEAGDREHGWYERFNRVAHGFAVAEGSGARLAGAEMWLHYNTLGGFNDPLFDDTRHEATQSFEESALRLTKKVPLRDDLTATFVLNLGAFTHDDRARQVDILQRLLAIAPYHRGALWELGQLWLHTPGHEHEGVEMLQKAAALGVERVYPITDGQLKAVAP